MARLGEQLTAAGLVSIEKVEQALRAQVVWGARLGTNLIELGCIDLDELSRQLGQQHGVPAALARHFDKADPELQALLPAEYAKKWSVVPLVRLSDDRIAVVALDPLNAVARDVLSGIYGVDPINGIVTSVAAEMRVLYHLERVYQIARPTRYLRQKGANVTPFPQLDMGELEIEVEPDIVEELAPIDVDIEVDLEADDGATATSAASAASPSSSMPTIDLAEVEALLEHAIETAPEVVSEAQPVGRDRRTYLRTLADEGSNPAVLLPRKPPTQPPPPTPSLDPPTARASFDSPTVSAPAKTAEALRADADARGVLAPTEDTTTRPSPDGEARPVTDVLGRIAIRRVAVTPSSGVEKVVEKPASAPTNFAESTRAIKRGPNRDRVAELVIETLQNHVPSCQAALLLVIRGEAAIGWKQFSRENDGTAEVAVPLDQDGQVPSTIARKTATRCEAGQLNAIDVRLLRAVGNGDGADLAIVPIMVADQVMCLLAAATVSESELAPLEAVASAASAAFVRLIRDASR